MKQRSNTWRKRISYSLIALMTSIVTSVNDVEADYMELHFAYRALDA